MRRFPRLSQARIAARGRSPPLCRGPIVESMHGQRSPAPAAIGRRRRRARIRASKKAYGLAWRDSGRRSQTNMSKGKDFRPRKRGFDDDGPMSYESRPRHARSQGGPPDAAFGGPPIGGPAPAGGNAVDAVVKWFKADKGYGFVELAEGKGDAFLHANALHASGHESVPSGAKLKVLVGAGAKGFGFVASDDGGKDVFVHISILGPAGISHLTEGQQVNMRVVDTPKGREAISLSV